jgi:hypothetical protein
MSTLVAAPRKSKPITLHTVLVALMSAAFLGIVVYVLAIGLNYYLLPLSDRAFHPLHRQLRPAGSVGLGFGIFSTAIFAVIYVYPLRKKWAWLRGIGKTKHWLDFHIVMGLAAPLLVAIHGAFKFGGLAGMAYWIMMAVVISGIVGRYLYAQIPRSKKDAELSLAELQSTSSQLSEDLRSQNLIAEAVWQPLVTPMRREEALKMPLGRAMGRMLALDMARPFRMAALRRHGLPPAERIWTLGGLMASSHPDLERVVALVQRQSWLGAKICFLDRAGQIFKMWHVVHRPFSYAFLLLLAIHIGMAMWMGFL